MKRTSLAVAAGVSAIAALVIALPAQELRLQRAAPALSAGGAPVDILLKVEGIDGESTDAQYKGWIDAQGYSMGASQTGAASHVGGAGAGRVTLTDLSVTKPIDGSSPKLFVACASGQHFPAVTVAIRRRGGAEVMRYTLSDVLISSFKDGSEASAFPAEEVSFNYTKIELKVTSPGKPEIKGSFDQKSMKAQ